MVASNPSETSLREAGVSHPCVMGCPERIRSSESCAQDFRWNENSSDFPACRVVLMACNFFCFRREVVLQEA